ncbi:unnamed protein product [Amoebophrya sp. A120]|nr:unnamed protein product [Amoebophrya sp. A120]|eukprot:GSA120T00014046001.1
MQLPEIFLGGDYRSEAAPRLTPQALTLHLLNWREKNPADAELLQELAGNKLGLLSSEQFDQTGKNNPRTTGRSKEEKICFPVTFGENSNNSCCLFRIRGRLLWRRAAELLPVKMESTSTQVVEVPEAAPSLLRNKDYSNNPGEYWLKTKNATGDSTSLSFKVHGNLENKSDFAGAFSGEGEAGTAGTREPMITSDRRGTRKQQAQRPYYNSVSTSAAHNINADQQSRFIRVGKSAVFRQTKLTFPVNQPSGARDLPRDAFGEVLEPGTSAYNDLLSARNLEELEKLDAENTLFDASQQDKSFSVMRFRPEAYTAMGSANRNLLEKFLANNLSSTVSSGGTEHGERTYLSDLQLLRRPRLPLVDVAGGGASTSLSVQEENIDFHDGHEAGTSYYQQPPFPAFPEDDNLAAYQNENPDARVRLFLQYLQDNPAVVFHQLTPATLLELAHSFGLSFSADLVRGVLGCGPGKMMNNKWSSTSSSASTATGRTNDPAVIPALKKLVSKMVLARTLKHLFAEELASKCTTDDDAQDGVPRKLYSFQEDSRSGTGRGANNYKIFSPQEVFVNFFNRCFFPGSTASSSSSGDHSTSSDQSYSFEKPQLESWHHTTLLPSLQNIYPAIPIPSTEAIVDSFFGAEFALQNSSRSAIGRGGQGGSTLSTSPQQLEALNELEELFHLAAAECGVRFTEFFSFAKLKTGSSTSSATTSRTTSDARKTKPSRVTISDLHQFDSTDDESFPNAVFLRRSLYHAKVAANGGTSWSNSNTTNSGSLTVSSFLDDRMQHVLHEYQRDLQTHPAISGETTPRAKRILWPEIFLKHSKMQSKLQKFYEPPHFADKTILTGFYPKCKLSFDAVNSIVSASAAVGRGQGVKTERQLVSAVSLAVVSGTMPPPRTSIAQSTQMNNSFDDQFGFMASNSMPNQLAGGSAPSLLLKLEDFCQLKLSIDRTMLTNSLFSNNSSTIAASSTKSNLIHLVRAMLASVTAERMLVPTHLILSKLEDVQSILEYLERAGDTTNSNYNTKTTLLGLLKMQTLRLEVEMLTLMFGASGAFTDRSSNGRKTRATPRTSAPPAGSTTSVLEKKQNQLEKLAEEFVMRSLQDPNSNLSLPLLHFLVLHGFNVDFFQQDDAGNFSEKISPTAGETIIASTSLAAHQDFAAPNAKFLPKLLYDKICTTFGQTHPTTLKSATLYCGLEFELLQEQAEEEALTAAVEDHSARAAPQTSRGGLSSIPIAGSSSSSSSLLAPQPNAKPTTADLISQLAKITATAEQLNQFTVASLGYELQAKIFLKLKQYEKASEPVENLISFNETVFGIYYFKTLNALSYAMRLCVGYCDAEYRARFNRKLTGKDLVDQEHMGDTNVETGAFLGPAAAQKSARAPPTIISTTASLHFSEDFLALASSGLQFGERILEGLKYHLTAILREEHVGLQQQAEVRATRYGSTSTTQRPRTSTPPTSNLSESKRRMKEQLKQRIRFIVKESFFLKCITLSKPEMVVFVSHLESFVKNWLSTREAVGGGQLSYGQRTYNYHRDEKQRTKTTSYYGEHQNEDQHLTKLLEDMALFVAKQQLQATHHSCGGQRTATSHGTERFAGLHHFLLVHNAKLELATTAVASISKNSKPLKQHAQGKERLDFALGRKGSLEKDQDEDLGSFIDQTIELPPASMISDAITALLEMMRLERAGGSRTATALHSTRGTRRPTMNTSSQNSNQSNMVERYLIERFSTLSSKEKALKPGDWFTEMLKRSDEEFIAELCQLFVEFGLESAILFQLEASHLRGR